MSDCGNMHRVIYCLQASERQKFDSDLHAFIAEVRENLLNDKENLKTEDNQACYKVSHFFNTSCIFVMLLFSFTMVHCSTIHMCICIIMCINFEIQTLVYGYYSQGYIVSSSLQTRLRLSACREPQAGYVIMLEHNETIKGHEVEHTHTHIILQIMI